MYVTIIPTPGGRLVAHGPTPDPVAVAEPAISVVVCPPSAVARSTWRLCHPYEFAAASQTLTELAEQRPTDPTVTGLNAPTVAVCVHPFSRRMLAIGPFTGPDRAEQWWHARINRLANGEATCHILPLTTPEAINAERPTGGAA